MCKHKTRIDITAVLTVEVLISCINIRYSIIIFIISIGIPIVARFMFIRNQDLILNLVENL